MQKPEGLHAKIIKEIELLNGEKIETSWIQLSHDGHSVLKKSSKLILSFVIDPEEVPSLTTSTIECTYDITTDIGHVESRSFTFTVLSGLGVNWQNKSTAGVINGLPTCYSFDNILLECSGMSRRDTAPSILGRNTTYLRKQVLSSVLTVKGRQDVVMIDSGNYLLFNGGSEAQDKLVLERFLSGVDEGSVFSKLSNDNSFTINTANSPSALNIIMTNYKRMPMSLI